MSISTGAMGGAQLSAPGVCQHGKASTACNAPVRAWMRGENERAIGQTGAPAPVLVPNGGSVEAVSRSGPRMMAWMPGRRRGAAT